MDQAQVPINLRASYEIHIVPSPSAEVHAVRGVRAAHVGCLVRVDALVTKVSSVKPRIQVATYSCNECGAYVFQSVNSAAYMPLTDCNASLCVRKKAKGELVLQIRESRFTKYQ